jgi:hypothetical protein
METMQVLKVAGVLLFGGAFAGMSAQAPADATKAKDQKDQKVVVEGKPEVAAAAPVGGQTIAYKAVAGTITVGYSDAYDAMLGLDGKLLADSGMNPPDAAKPEEHPATARMFYTAYFKKDAAPGTRPVIFMYNGGPGSATMWLHMGSFGPRRVVTPDTEHQAAAPYALVDNKYSLLDVAGDGLQPGDGQGCAEGVLWRGRGCACVRAVYPAVSDQVRSLELAEVSVWRELRDAAFGGVERGVAERRFEWDRAAVGDFELR